jgi:hypothetical protein
VAISGRLARKLQETMGAEAGEDLMSWMQGMESQRWEFRELRGELGALRGDLGTLRGEIGTLREQLTAFGTRTEVGLARLETLIEKRHASLMRWSFAYWMGSVAGLTAAVAVLDRFLR